MITHIDTPTAVFQLPGQPGLTSCPLNCQSPPVITTVPQHHHRTGSTYKYRLCPSMLIIWKVNRLMPCLQSAYRCQHDAAPHHLITSTVGRQHLQSTSAGMLLVPQTRTTIGQRSFVVNGLITCNQQRTSFTPLIRYDTSDIQTSSKHISIPALTLLKVKGLNIYRETLTSSGLQFKVVY